MKFLAFRKGWEAGYKDGFQDGVRAIMFQIESRQIVGQSAEIAAEVKKGMQ